MDTVLITGGSGLIGQRLSKRLLSDGYQVAILSRLKRKSNDIQYYQWEPERQRIEEEAIKGADYIVHLAGAGIAEKRWTKKRKAELYNSRIHSTQLLYDTLKNTASKLKAFISSSAIGFYGNRKNQWLTEDVQAGNDFLAGICKDWEAQANKLNELGIRTVINRTGIVLSREGGALPELEKPMSFGIAPYLGSGQMYYSWIHVDDVIGIIMHEIKNDLQGIFNMVAPPPVKNKDLMKAIVKAKKSHALIVPAPELALKLALGEMAQTILGSQRCSANKIAESGYRFLFPELEDALLELYSD